MRITFLLPTAYDLGGTAGAVATQAGALCADHEVRVLSLVRRDDEPHFRLDPRVVVTDLVDLRPGHERAGDLTADQVRALQGRPTRLLDPAWDPQLDALADVGLEAVLPTLETDVLVTVTPALLALATSLAPPGVAVVHQEHRSSSQRRASRDLLLTAARRADAVAMLAEPMAAWMRRELGPDAPEVVVVPNALPPAYRPRSPLTSPVVVAAGRLASEKQYPQLVTAFAHVADRLPQWRLRIFGDGPHRFAVQGTVRRLGLWDRVELPGPTTDLAAEWARASISALTSSSEGYPLVLQEAMAAGVPVISYDCPSGPREIVDDGVDGLLVAAGSVDAMAAGLLRLAGDADERARLGAAAHAASARWDPAVVAARWEQVYAAAVDRRAASRGAGRATALHLAEPADPAAVGAPTPDQDRAPAGREGHGVTPEQARHAALAAACAAAEEATADAGAAWWVVPPHATDAPTVVLPMTARRAFLAALARAEERGELAAYLSVHDPPDHGWPSHRGTAMQLLAPLTRGRTSRLLIEPWPRVGDHASLLGRGCGVVVELWEVGPDDDLHAPGTARYADRAPRSPTLVASRVHDVEVPTHELMTRPTVEDCTLEVDAVWTPADLDPARSAAREGLRWSMRSVHLLAPWVRRLHVVTAGPPPAWLDPDHPRVTLVDEGIPLHRAEGLAEHVLHLDDHLLLARPRRPEDFFGPDGSTAVFCSTEPIGLPGQEDPASAATRRLLEEAFGRVTVQALASAPRAERRSRLAEVAERFGPEGTTELSSLSSLSSLSAHYGLMTGTAHLADHDHAVLDLTDAGVGARLRALLERDRDGWSVRRGPDSARDPAQVERLLAETLEQLLPVAAPWER